MRKGRNFLEMMMDQSSLSSESVPGQPIIEIAGEHRVLIENHQGVSAYGKDRILVNVKFGCICICGCNLEMLQMTKEQLVIYGRIDTIGLQRRK